MMYRIKSGTHRAKPLRFGLFYKRTNVSRSVTFQTDCAYMIPGEDQQDENKLFGLGFFWGPHTNSARFGWRYDIGKGGIVLSAYCYVNGKRIIKELTVIELLEPVTLDLLIMPSAYCFSVDGKELAVIPFTHRKKWSYPLNLYFGGNQTAPGTMHIEMKSL